MVAVLVQDATSVCIRMDMYVHAWQDRNYAITGQWDSHHNIQPLYDMYTAYDVHTYLNTTANQPCRSSVFVFDSSL